MPQAHTPQVPDARLPARLHNAEQGRLALAEAGVHFAPVRHHSPACAFALRALIEEIRPAAVLIEGPADFDRLLPDLLAPHSRPPLAILSQHRASAAEATLRSAFFPFCDYSPEWQALREGHRLGAKLAFIDLPWARQQDAEDDADNSRSLMAERYLAHSDYIAALARQAHCRDHDELWEHLFELRPRQALQDWRRLFGDTFAWCSMARLDYEDDVLAGEGSLAREAHMLACIEDWRTRCEGPLLIVTGGFHSLALVEALASPASNPPATDMPHSDSQAWLIRYSFDRLDALNGYASGMPSPAYYQRVWDALLDEQAGDDSRQRIATQFLSAIAGETRARQLADSLSFASVSSAAQQAAGLASLRGHPGPGRYDLLDAIHSCFVKGSLDDGQAAFLAAVRSQLSGNRLGDVPPSAQVPPLVAQARRLAMAHRLDLSDSLPRRARLDLYRKPRHRARGRFLQLMAYLDSGFVRHRGGPDFVNGTGLDLLFEEWEYAWSPLVEARLIECSELGSSLHEVALRKLLGEEQALQGSGQGRSASRAVQLLARAGLVGLGEQLPRLFERLAEHLDEDPELSSVVTCGQRLLHLWRGRELLGLEQHTQLPALLQRILPAALFLLPGLETCAPEREATAIKALLGLREFVRLGASQAGLEVQQEALHEELERLAAQAPAGIAGALDALRFVDDRDSEEQLANALALRFGPGADSESAVRYLNGLLTAAPELILRIDTLAQQLNHLVAQWNEDTFVRHLPDLRLAFTRLKPRETGRLADSLAALNGMAAAGLDSTHHELDGNDLLAGAALQLALGRSLARDGLLGWATEGLDD